MTYSTNDDVNQRLDLSSSRLSDKSTELDGYRETAYNWIVFKFAERDVDESDLPDESSLNGSDKILKQIEADYAAYLYRRDRTEFNEGEGTPKELRWKREAEENIERYLKLEYTDTFYGVSED